MGRKSMAPLILNPCTSWRWSAVRPGCLTPRKWATSTHYTEGFLGPRAGLDTLEKTKNLLLLPRIEPQLFGLPTRSLVITTTKLSLPPFLWLDSSYWVEASRSHSGTTLSRTLLDEQSTRSREIYMTTHNTPKYRNPCPRWDSNP
jgi:hypothetical protein